MGNHRITRRRLVLTVGRVAMLLTVLAFGIGALSVAPAPASAAVAVPSHGAIIRCNTFDESFQIYASVGSFAARWENVAWYPRIQVWEGSYWRYIPTTPYTDRWTAGPANRYVSQQFQYVIGPTSGTYGLNGWYRIASWFYWSDGNRIVGPEYSTPCLLQGIEVA